jgi:hypothetical protein
MNKKIISIISLIVVIIIFLFFVFKKTSLAPSTETTPSETAKIENNLATTTAPVKTQPVSANANSVKNNAWAVFQKYLGYNKDHNLDGVKAIVYKVNVVCESKVATDECKNRMDLAYSYGSALKKADFVNVWSDGKQTILATDFKLDEDNTFLTRTRAIMFFIGSGSDLKLLSFSPFKGDTVEKSASTTRDELLKKLTLETADSDNDGIFDYQEECSSPYASANCIKTNPALRDTDGDGLWDGVEALLTK